MTRLVSWSALLLLLVIPGCGPFALLPGGELSGSTAAVPEDWAVAEEVSTIQLETRPSDPYSVNIWAVGIGRALYVHAGTNRATWCENMEEDPRVRVRVEDTVYELAATRVEDPEEFARFADAYEEKYDRRPRNENVSEVYLFRLAAR